MGLPDLVITGFYGLMAPPKTSPDVVATLNAALKKALASAELRKSFDAMSFDVGNGSADDLAAIISRGRERYSRIVAERNIRVE